MRKPQAAALRLTEAEIEAVRLACSTMLLAMTGCKSNTDADYLTLQSAINKIGTPAKQKPMKVKGWTGARCVPKSVE